MLAGGKFFFIALKPYSLTIFLRCGIAAVQLAKAMGAGHIAGVCSGKNEAIVRSYIHLFSISIPVLEKQLGQRKWSN